MTLVFIAYELFDELTNFFPVALNLHEVHVLIFTIVIFLVRKRLCLSHACVQHAHPSPLYMCASAYCWRPHGHGHLESDIPTTLKCSSYRASGARLLV